ncbi:unnamed protein product [Soboliphyme baturini]|uniref:Med12 domain-containing protein n=1 Tax=Soboliphyme baturini TaxID=241478 RepID=A0A183JAK1_9BILA|nr:unnamed protein product [Soboliphyme baturini]
MSVLVWYFYREFPFLKKKEEILSTLAEFNVPIVRAVWFLKMTNAHYTQQQESGKIKKKQMNDPYSEWTQHIIRYLRDLLLRLSEYYLLTSQSAMTADIESAFKQWQYCTRLSRHMFEVRTR